MTENFNTVNNGALQFCDNKAVKLHIADVFKIWKDSDSVEVVCHKIFNNVQGSGKISSKFIRFSIGTGGEREIEIPLAHTAKEQVRKKP